MISITELVRHTCHEATARAARGEGILVKSNGGRIFKICSDNSDEALPHLHGLEADLQRLGKSALTDPGN